MIYVIIPLIILIFFYFFSSKVSPIPYFPTNKSDLDMIVKALDMRKDGAVIDLGAGDGTVIFAAAQKAHEQGLNTQFYAIDINPILIGYMSIQRLFHANGSNITLILGDMFKLDYISLLKPFSSSVFYIYISPWFTAATAQMIHDQKLKSQIVSYFYPVQDKKEDQKIKGIHDVYIYKN